MHSPLSNTAVTLTQLQKFILHKLLSHLLSLMTHKSKITHFRNNSILECIPTSLKPDITNSLQCYFRRCIKLPLQFIPLM